MVVVVAVVVAVVVVVVDGIVPRPAQRLFAALVMEEVAFGKKKGTLLMWPEVVLV